MGSQQDILEKVIAFADEAHGGQMRKYTPDRYIVHPVRVMEICRQYTDDLAILSAAILHDVLEDTPVTREAIYSFLSEIMGTEDAQRTLGFVVELTDVYVKKDYPRWNRKQRKMLEAERLSNISSGAQLIKYADILDNSKEIAAQDRGFAPRFLKECRGLLACMDRGDERLRGKATAKVESELIGLKR